MKKPRVIIIGAGLTGLSTAYFLVKKGYKVTILEKDAQPGGMTSTFRCRVWKDNLEKTYHHWFTNDKSILTLSKEIGHNFKIYSPTTNVYVNGKSFRFDTPLSILKFPHLSWLDKARLGFSTYILKLSPVFVFSKKTTAIEWLNRVAGKNVTRMIWEPLLQGKFGRLKNKISIVWFWARVKKRTAKLVYPEGGFYSFTNDLIKYLKKYGVIFYFKADVEKIISSNNDITIKTSNSKFVADKVLVTTPTPIFTRIVFGLSKSYMNKLSKIKHLSAQILLIVFKKPFMKNVYWLNVLERKFPFLGVVEHTNFISPKRYSNEHIVYAGNYLSEDHFYFKKNKTELFKIFYPFLRKINKNINNLVKDLYLFNVPYAQPVVDINYHKNIPDIKTPIKNVYLANIDMIYPWDRGTNYSVELGEKAAKIIAEGKQMNSLNTLWHTKILGF